MIKGAQEEHHHLRFLFLFLDFCLIPFLFLFFLFLFVVQGLNKGETLEASDHGSNHAFARRGSVARLIAPIRAQPKKGGICLL